MSFNENWPQGDSVKKVSVGSLYELRDVFTRLSGEVKLDKSYEGVFDYTLINGAITAFEFDNSIDTYDNTKYDDWGKVRNIDITPLHQSINPTDSWSSPDKRWHDSFRYRDVYKYISSNYNLGLGEDGEKKYYEIGLDVDSVEFKPKDSGTISIHNQFQPDSSEKLNEIRKEIDVEQLEASGGHWLNAVSSLSRYNEQDILIELTDNFWENVKKTHTSTDDAKEIKLENDSFKDGSKIIDLSKYEADNIVDLAASVTQDLRFSLSSNSPLLDAEFGQLVRPGAYFTNESGHEIFLPLVDHENPWTTVTGLTSVDVETDKAGNHVRTELEFGISEFGIGFLEGREEASQSQIDSNNDPLKMDRWELDRIQLSGERSVFPSGSSLQNTANNFILSQDEDIFFFVKGGYTLAEHSSKKPEDGEAVDLDEFPPKLLLAQFTLNEATNTKIKLVDTDISFDESIYDTSGGDYLELGYAIKGSDLTGNPGGEASTFGVDSTGLKNVAVLGPNTSDSNSYTLEISAESKKQGWKLESADIVLKYNSELFKEITLEDIELTSDLPIKNAVAIDDEKGLIRFAAASLGDLDGEGTSIFDENIFASIKLDFDETYFNDIASNPDQNGKFTIDGNPLGFKLNANRNETVFSRTFNSDADGTENVNGTFTNRQIKSLGDLKGGISIDDEDVNLYQAEIKFKEINGGLTFGTKRVIGSSQDFTNLIRKNDTVTAKTTIENVGNSLAKDVTISDAGNLVHARFASSRFVDQNGDEIVVGSDNPIDLSGGVFNDDFSYDSTKQESVDVEIDMKVTGDAGKVIDTTKGLFEVTANGMTQNPDSTAKVFTSSSGSKNLITFQGDLNYDGRVSMKDLAFLNAGAARQKTTEQSPSGIDSDNNGIVDASVARDVDADFNGKIDIADLSVLDQDWGQSLHSGTSETFTGSDSLDWGSLDSQAGATWDNSSFKQQNAIEAEDSYVGSLETTAATGDIGADGTNDVNNNDITGTESQNQIPA